jgi:hypothetical protein
LLWTAQEAWRDKQEVPSGNRAQKKLAWFVVVSTWAKLTVMAVFCYLSLRAMTLPPATTNEQGASDVGAILVLVSFLVGELAMTAAAGYGVWVRQYIKGLPAERRIGRDPSYTGPNRRKS